MSHPEQQFTTEIDGIEGIWPEAPHWFSYSSFTEAEECPRRWALRRASYPSVWANPGYPERASVAGVVGDVVHGALEEIVRSLTDAGTDSGGSSDAVGVLRSIGGYSGVVERAIAKRAATLEANPRMAPRLENFLRELRSHLPEMRQRTQAALSRTRLVPRSTQSHRPDDGVTVGEGSYPEFNIVSTSLAWAGRVDLLTIKATDVHILDYKTGAPSEHHAEQLRTYALLWSRRDAGDSVHPRATRLTISYATHDADVPSPSDDELRALERDLVARSTEAKLAVGSDRPARPSPENCAFCSVRHLCDAYWKAIPMVSEGSTDAEFTVRARNGPRSFSALLLHSTHEILVRVAEDVSIDVGSRWRLLNGYGVRGDDGELAVSVTGASELYRVRSA